MIYYNQLSCSTVQYIIVWLARGGVGQARQCARKGGGEWPGFGLVRCIAPTVSIVSLSCHLPLSFPAFDSQLLRRRSPKSWSAPRRSSLGREAGGDAERPGQVHATLPGPIAPVLSASNPGFEHLRLVSLDERVCLQSLAFGDWPRVEPVASDWKRCGSSLLISDASRRNSMRACRYSDLTPAAAPNSDACENKDRPQGGDRRIRAPRLLASRRRAGRQLWSGQLGGRGGGHPAVQGGRDAAAGVAGSGGHRTCPFTLD